NFTNLGTAPENFISRNPHFCKSALSRYSQWDFLELVNRYGIAWHEKTLGQLFCDNSAKQIVAMLRSQMNLAGADLWLDTSVVDVSKTEAGFVLSVQRDGHQAQLTSHNLVLATGGKSIPKMGATGFAYDIARKFGLAIVETRPGLVPLTFSDRRFAALSGISQVARASAGPASFEEAVLFTHRGLSGPAILQASSYWREGEAIQLDLDPQAALLAHLQTARQSQGKKDVSTILAQKLPARLVDHLSVEISLTGRIGDHSNSALDDIVSCLRNWRLTPSGSEGYRTAEVTLGGIDTAGVSSKTMEAKSHPSLYVIGEALDVTGWLGGYNFQWAWSSGWAAGTAIAEKS
ncbi:MAG: aminoacetone oxidase family FAD-binding enzyme, partial [Pseudomonadota bacterium]